MNHISQIQLCVEFCNLQTFSLGPGGMCRCGLAQQIGSQDGLKCRVSVKCIPVSAKTLLKPIELPVGEIIRMEYNSAASSYEAMLSQ